MCSTLCHYYLLLFVGFCLLDLCFIISFLCLLFCVFALYLVYTYFVVSYCFCIVLCIVSPFVLSLSYFSTSLPTTATGWNLIAVNIISYHISYIIHIISYRSLAGVHLLLPKCSHFVEFVIYIYIYI